MRSLATKLILGFLIIGLSVSALVAVLAGQVTANEFGDFLFNQNQQALEAQLTDYYKTQGGWTDVDQALASLFDPEHGGDPRILLADVSGQVVAGRSPFGDPQTLTNAELAQGTALVVNGQKVGTLVQLRANFGLPPPAVLVLGRINRALIIATLGAAGLALLLGWLLARVFTYQLRELTAATRKIASGEFGEPVVVRSRDEIGQLAESFNLMSRELAHARDVRRQMTADIAHELRTPLSIILGHTEALRDRVLPASHEIFFMLHDEALRLNRLVEDLRTLSLADAGELPLNRRDVSPGKLLERALAANAPRLQQKGLELQAELGSNLPEINVDQDRILQVLNNLLDNAARHTPSGGRIIGRVRVEADQRVPPALRVVFAIVDSGPGITAADLPNIFERFYRADKSRQHDSNGSGLGLAIAKSIIEAHGGRIWAENEPGSGAKFLVELPGLTDI
jgi:signal transduction histidine kinase